MKSSVKDSVLLFFVLGQVHTISLECGQAKLDENTGFPWNVGIYVDNGHQLELVCFGTIIETNAFLTAAHCFYDNIGNTFRNTSFYVATSNLKEEYSLQNIPKNFQKLQKNDVVIQKFYKGLINLLSSDLALVKAKFDEMKAICVDWSGTIQDNNFVGQQTIWHEDKVLNIEQFYVNSQDCLQEAPQEFVPFVTNDKLCTKNPNTKVRLSHESEGSGVAFYIAANKKWYLKGVTSMNDPKQGQFATYTLVQQYLNWISNIYAAF